MWILVLCSKLVKYDVVLVRFLMNSWSIGVVVDIRCCCWWFMLWVFMIMELVVKFELFLKVLWKMGELVICDEMMFLIKVLYGFECLWKRIRVLGNQNWGFRVKMEIFPESIIFENCHNSPWRVGGEWEASDICVNSPWRVIWWPWRVAQYNNSYFVIFRVSGRSEPFQTNSFDVIKYNWNF